MIAHPQQTCLYLAPLLALVAACDGDQDKPRTITYTVVQGDTLTRIARAHGTSVKALRADNKLKGDHIEVGQVLLIPQGDSAPANAPAPSAASPRRTKRTAGGGHHLRMPKQQPCLSGPTLTGGDDQEPQMISSTGLTRSQIRTAMNPMMTKTQHCIDGVWPQGVITLQVTVGCNGRVSDVDVTDGGGMDPALIACVQDTLRYTGFPPHDMPDGYTFGYPLRFSSDTP